MEPRSLLHDISTAILNLSQGTLRAGLLQPELQPPEKKDFQPCTIRLEAQTSSVLFFVVVTQRKQELTHGASF
jgi:hypothetical protein